MGEHEDLTPAARLLRLLEFGSTPIPKTPLPEAWLPYFDAVWYATGGRDARWQAFLALIDPFNPEHRAIQDEVQAARALLAHRAFDNIKVHSAREAFGPPPQLEWLVPDLFTRPSLNILVGDPGSKKTLLSLDLAVCIAAGQPWLGRPVVQTPVFLVDLETGRPRLFDRIHSALVAHNADPETPLYFQSLPIYDLTNEQHRSNISFFLQEYECGLLVIDALASLLRGTDENNSTSVYPVLNSLRILAEESNTAILLVHHLNKSGVFRGSSAISAAVDLMLSIESPPESDLVHLRPLKAREASPAPFNARAHFEPGRVWFSPEAAEPKSKAKTRSARRLLVYLNQHGPTATPKLIYAFKKMTSTAVRQLVYDLKASGHIARLNAGGRGSRATFELTPKGRLSLEGELE